MNKNGAGAVQPPLAAKHSHDVGAGKAVQPADARSVTANDPLRPENPKAPKRGSRQSGAELKTKLSTRTQELTYAGSSSSWASSMALWMAELSP